LWEFAQLEQGEWFCFVLLGVDESES